ncbi:MAG: DUF1302 family protein [Bacillota bacterium]
MRRSLIIMCALIVSASLLIAPVSAEESAFGSSTAEESSTMGSAFSAASTESSSEQQLSWSGSLELDTRAILDKNDQSDIETDLNLDLDLNYRRDNSEVEATLNFVEGEADIEEAFMRLYYDNFDLAVGKKKEVWGKGDQLHVVDHLNGQDLTDFINPEYLERQIGEEMIKTNYYLGSGTLEVVYTPEFTPNNLAQEGNWVVNEMQQLNDLEPTLINEFGLTAAAKVQDSFAELDHEVEDGQLALRYTNSKSGYDYGFSFYQGYLKTASMNQTAIAKLKQGAYSTNQWEQFIADLNFHYDQVSILGAEFSSVLAGINSRAEIAYFLTEDTAGTDIDVHNNKIAGLIGGDRDLPWHNLNLNLQVKSEYILDNEEIENNPSDLEYNKDEQYFNNLVVLEVQDEFDNQNILPSTTVAYNLGTDDYFLDNEIEFKLKDDASLQFNYKLFGGDSQTEFGQFANNDYLSAKFTYDF